MMQDQFLADFLDRQRFLTLDGGLATELERRGIDLFDPLWSAKALLDTPDQVRAVHADYLAAGADIIATASYQATIPGLRAKGLSAAQAIEVIRLSVALARDARDQFVASHLTPDRVGPLVAGSIGPYGAYLHDGSEFRGDYQLTDRELKAFHRPRLDILAEAGVDLIACETIPSRREAEVLVDLLEVRADLPAWISFTTRDDTTIADGSPFADAIASVSQASKVIAVGVNCTPAERVAGLLECAGPRSHKPFVVYPNAGGEFDATTGRWVGDANPDRLPDLVEHWFELGARMIGGCCRTTPATIERIRGRLVVS